MFVKVQVGTCSRLGPRLARYSHYSYSGYWRRLIKGPASVKSGRNATLGVLGVGFSESVFYSSYVGNLGQQASLLSHVFCLDTSLYATYLYYRPLLSRVDGAANRLALTL